MQDLSGDVTNRKVYYLIPHEYISQENNDPMAEASLHKTSSREVTQFLICAIPEPQDSYQNLSKLSFLRQKASVARGVGVQIKISPQDCNHSKAREKHGRRKTLFIHHIVLQALP